jgi:hypothetical protein
MKLSLFSLLCALSFFSHASEPPKQVLKIGENIDNREIQIFECCTDTQVSDYCSYTKLYLIKYFPCIEQKFSHGKKEKTE